MASQKTITSTSELYLSNVQYIYSHSSLLEEVVGGCLLLVLLLEVPGSPLVQLLQLLRALVMQEFGHVTQDGVHSFRLRVPLCALVYVLG